MGGKVIVSEPLISSNYYVCTINIFSIYKKIKSNSIIYNVKIVSDDYWGLRDEKEKKEYN